MKNVVIGIGIVVILAAIGLFLSNKPASNPSQSPAIQTSPFTTESSPSAEATSPTQVKESNLVTLTADGFSPKTLTIKAGDKVSWINKSGTAATVDSSSHPTHTDYTPLNLGSFTDGETLSLTFDKAGTYKYHNHFNARQFGSIIAQ